MTVTTKKVVKQNPKQPGSAQVMQESPDHINCMIDKKADDIRKEMDSRFTEVKAVVEGAAAVRAVAQATADKLDKLQKDVSSLCHHVSKKQRTSSGGASSSSGEKKSFLL